MELLTQGAEKWGIHLTPPQLAAFQTYYQELSAWSERAGLTTITDQEDVEIQHFLDSLSCLLVLDHWLTSGTRVIDIGSGAGFPGLPIKIVRPGINLVLLEATRKKVEFLKHITNRLGLKEVAVLWSRAEEIGHDSICREAFKVVLGRAVGPLSVLLEYALPLLAGGGILVAQRGRGARREIEEASGGLSILGGRVREVRDYRLPGMQHPRHLVVVEKVAATPAQYPRRPGVPEKRPLA